MIRFSPVFVGTRHVGAKNTTVPGEMKGRVVSQEKHSGWETNDSRVTQQMFKNVKIYIIIQRLISFSVVTTSYTRCLDSFLD